MLQSRTEKVLSLTITAMLVGLVFGLPRSGNTWVGSGDADNMQVPQVRSPLDWPVIHAPPSKDPMQQEPLPKPDSEKLKSEARELLELAKSLQADLDRSNARAVSAIVVEKAERIERLARRVKKEAGRL